jgi:putative endonuclease
VFSGWLFIFPHHLDFMHYVYLIKSKNRSCLYIGCTSDLKKRLEEHNSGKSYYTRGKGPWTVRYYEAFFSKDDAFQREKQLKRHKRGIIELKKRIEKSLKV